MENADRTSTAAQDQDIRPLEELPLYEKDDQPAATKHIEPIQTILDALMGREPTEAEWENVPALAALRAIEQTLEADGAR